MQNIVNKESEFTIVIERNQSLAILIEDTICWFNPDYVRQ